MKQKLYPVLLSFLLVTELCGQIVSPDVVYENLVQDHIIPNTDPPEEYFDIEEGSCGEDCLFTVLKMQKIPLSQKEINVAGGNPGRGLHGDELLKALKKKRVRHKNISIYTSHYSDYLHKKIIPLLINNNPVLLGVKIYPDEHPEWSSDHFILLVGYNSGTNEIIYNSNNERSRISANKLLNKEDGYSLINKYENIFALQFPGSDTGKLYDDFIDLKYRANALEEIDTGLDTLIQRKYDKKGRISLDAYFVNDNFVYDRTYFYRKDSTWYFLTFPAGFFKRHDGLAIFYYKNDSIWSEMIYKKGKPWTVISKFDPAGNPVEKGTLNKGNGTLYIYKADGNLKRIKKFKNREK